MEASHPASMGQPMPLLDAHVSERLEQQRVPHGVYYVSTSQLSCSPATQPSLPWLALILRHASAHTHTHTHTRPTNPFANEHGNTNSVNVNLQT